MDVALMDLYYYALNGYNLECKRLKDNRYEIWVSKHNEPIVLFVLYPGKTMAFPARLGPISYMYWDVALPNG